MWSSASGRRAAPSGLPRSRACGPTSTPPRWPGSRKFPPAEQAFSKSPSNVLGPMPRAIWSGAISFGLVNIPVKLFSAVQRKTVRFHQLDQEDKQRIQQRRVNPPPGEEGPHQNPGKGYKGGPPPHVG